MSLFVHPSEKDVIAVKGTNTSSQSVNDRGIMGELTLAGSALVPASTADEANLERGNQRHRRHGHPWAVREPMRSSA